jgi:hypothetical protein
MAAVQPEPWLRALITNNNGKGKGTFVIVHVINA